MEHTLVITGASSGIGRAVALGLADWDGLLLLSGRSEERLGETLALLEAAGGRGAICLCDLRKSGDIEALIKTAEAQAPLHGLVHCGGEAEFAPAHEQPPETWAAQIEINLVAAYHLTHHALKFMLPRKRGHIIYINSVAGRQPFPASSAYVAAKHGLRGLADAVREEGRLSGIKVTTIYPGATDTPWWSHQPGEAPTERMLSADHVAQTVAFALSLSGPAVVEELVVRHVQGDF